MARSWDADRYDRIAAPQQEMARQLLERIELAGNEVVLDAGCGTGQVTEWLCERVPRGRVVAVDADPAMVEAAQQRLGERAEVRQADLCALALDDCVDVVFSSSTFHWITDHDRLFGRLAAALRPGGRLVAQCGGRNPHAGVMATARAVGESHPFSRFLGGWRRPSYFAGPIATTERLEGAGFVDVRCWFNPFLIVPDDPRGYLETVSLGPYLERLPPKLRRPYVDLVAARLPDPLEIRFVRLEIDARRA